MPTETTGLNTEQVNKLKGMSGINQNLLNTYKPSGPIQASVSADALVEQPKPMTVPEPAQANIPSNTLNVARNVSRDTDGFIAAQTAEAAKLKELQATYGALGNEGSLSDLFKNTQAEYGVTPESFKELKDIQLQLNDMDTKSGLNKVTIESGGQGAIQGQRSLTQEDREAAVRSASLAARASVLQGNIETATALAKDAVNIAYQDRTLTAQNLINQINMVQGQVDDQTAQLLEQEKRAYEAELASIKEVKDAVATAMVNGATQSEMAQLNDPTIDDATKLALAQQITARGANEMRNLDIASKSASIRSANASAAINEAELAKMSDPTLSEQQNADLAAYAMQYSDTGTLPSVTEMKQAGITASQVMDFAKQMPKPDGALVSTNTGTKSKTLTAEQEKGIAALNEIVTKTLPALKDRFGKINTGVLGGLGGMVWTSQDRQDYLTFRQEFLSKLLVARSGAAVTEQEYERYAAMVPSTFNQAFFLGSDGTKKLTSLETSMKGNLDTVLNNNQLSIYGYSKVDVGGEQRTVGEILDIGGTQYKVLPDGTLTDVI